MSDGTNSTSGTAELKATFDPSGVQSGVNTSKAALSDLARTAQQEGAKAGKGLEKAGEGAGEAASKIERETRSIIGSIERATAAAKAGERGTASYFEALGKQRGISADALKPYVEDLRRAEAAQKAASAGLGTMGISAAQTAAALRQVPAQFTDIATSLAAGQAPLTVFLQQGGQLKDTFGGAGAAARALGGYVLGLVNPFTIAAAAAGVALLAYNQGANEAQAYARALILSGNAAGTTAAQLQGLAAAQSKVVGTQSQAADALAQLAATGRISADQLGLAADAALRLARVGVPLDETIKKFAQLGKDPLKGLIELNEAENFLTESVYKQVKALTEQGRIADAAKIAIEEYARVGVERSDELRDSLGTLERGWLSLKSSAAKAWDAMLNVGREDTAQDKLARLRDEIAAAQAKVEQARSGQLTKDRPFLDAGRIAEAQQQRVLALQGESYALELVLQLEKENAEAKREGVVATKATIKADEDAAKSKSKVSAELEREAAALERAIGLSGSYYKDLAELVKLRQQSKLTEEQYVAAVQNLINAQPIVREQLQSENEARREAQKVLAEQAKAYERGLEAQYRSVERVDEHIQKLKDENAAILLSAESNISLAAAVEMLTAARLTEQRVKADASGDYLTAAALQAEIDKRKELAALINSKDARDSAKKAAEEATREWRRSANEIERSLTDALMRGFESGKGFAITLRDTLVNMFKTLVLRPVIQAIVQPVAGVLAGFGTSALAAAGLAAAGPAAAGPAAAGPAASALSGLGLLGSLGSAAKAGWGLALSGAGGTGLALEGALSMLQSGSTMQGLAQGAGALAPWLLGAGAGIFGGRAISGGLSAIGSSGNTSVNLGTAIGAAIGGPLGAALGGALGGVVNRAFGMGQKEARDSGITGTIGGGDVSGQSFQDWFQKGGWFRSNKSGTNFGALGSELEAGLDLGAQAILANTRAWANALQLPAEQLDSITSSFKTTLTGNADADQKAIAAVLQGYSDALTTGFAAQLSPFVKSGETAAQTLERLAASITGVNGVLGVLGQSLLAVSVSGADSAAKLLEQFGGLQPYQSAAGQYLQDYYSESERAALATQQLTAQLASVGVTLPQSRDAYRGLIEAQDLNTDAGRRAYAALVQLAPQFAALTPAVQGLGTAAQEAARLAEEAAARQVEAGRRVLADLATQRGSLEVELLRAQGDITGALARQREQDLARITDGLSAQDAAAATAAYDLNTALQAQIDQTYAAANAAKTAAQAELDRAAAAERAAADVAAAEAQRVRAVAAEREQLEVALLRATGDTAGIRAKELAALDATNRDLQQRLYLLADQADAERIAQQQAADLARAAEQQAADAARAASEQARAAEEQARAAQQLRDAWQGITDSIYDEVTRLRQLATGGSSQTLAAAQANFTIGLAQSRAGDQDAARNLPALSQALLAVAEKQVADFGELQRLRLRLAAQLESVGQQVSLQYGLTIPRLATGTNRVPADMLAVIHRGEAVVPAPFNPANGGGFGSADVVDAINGLRAEQKAQALAIVTTQRDVAKVLKAWNADGMPDTRVEVTV